MQPNLYELLGVKRSATSEKINAAYRKLAFELHPDRNPDPDATEKLKLINMARTMLADNLKRIAYDNSVGQSNRNGGQHAWFCPQCETQVFISQHIWRCNQCGLWGRLYGSILLDAPKKPHPEEMYKPIRETAKQRKIG